MKIYVGSNADEDCSIWEVQDKRLVVFFSDARVPHEVMPVPPEGADRYAVSVWYSHG